MFIWYPPVEDFPGGSDGKESSCNVGDPGSTPGSGGSPGEGNGNLHQYSCLENSMHRGAWRAPVHGVAKYQTQLRDLTLKSRAVIQIFTQCRGIYVDADLRPSPFPHKVGREMNCLIFSCERISLLHHPFGPY